MGCESSYEARFDLGPFVHGEMKTATLKVLITHLLMVLEVCILKSTYGKSWTGNLVIWSDLILGLYFRTNVSLLMRSDLT